MNKPVTPDQIRAQAIGKSASQSTEIERSRAVAQVQAAYVMAQQRPRDETICLERGLRACRTMEVADGAFYKFKRGDGSVTGPSIQLAVELALAWGNIDYGIVELSRNDEARESEMLAYAVDLETNVRSSLGFIVPHIRDTKSGPKALTDVRDIYENNANMGARRLRECIFRILPAYVKEAAQAECHATLRAGGGEKPLQVRLVEMVSAFEGLGISRARIEAKLGPIAGLTDVDLANLKISYRSVTRNEINAEEEFPRVGAEEATAAARKIANKPEPRQHTATADNPAAAEGPGDDERGEAHNGADDHPARRVADEIIRAATTQGTIIDLANLKAARSGDVAAMPDDIAEEVSAAFAAAEQRLKAPRS